MRKKHIINGLLAAAGFLVVFSIIYTIRFGLSWWNSPENDILVFFPIWGIVAVYIGYSASVYYYKEKAQIFAEKEDIETLNKNWNLHKRMELAKVLKNLAKVFAMILPLYVLVYMDGSKTLKSSLGIIIGLVVIAILCFVLSKTIVKSITAKNT